MTIKVFTLAMVIDENDAGNATRRDFRARVHQCTQRMNVLQAEK